MKNKDMSYFLAYLFPLILGLFACSKDDRPVSQIEKPPKRLDILWRTPIVPDPNIYFSISMNPTLTDSVVVFGTEYNLYGKHAPLLFMDTATGFVLDTWSEYIDGNALYESESTSQEGKFLLMSTLSSIDCVNLETRKTQWRKIIPGNSAYIYSRWGRVFTATSSSDNRSASILSSYANRESLKPIFNFSKTDKYVPFFDGLGFGQLPNGDKVIAWKNRSSSGNNYRTDIFAFNFSADTLLWRNKELALPSSIVPMQIEGDFVYGLVSEHFIALNLLTGKVAYKSNIPRLISPRFPLGFWFADFYLSSDHVYIYGDSEELVILNKNDGSLNKVVRGFSGPIADRFTFFEDKLFFSTGHLQIVDVNTGERIVEDSFTEDIDDIRGSIVIDSTRRVMYFHNGREAFCAKIPSDI